MEYIFRSPTYKPFPYELALAERELSTLARRVATREGGDLTLCVRTPLPLDRLRRLAFSSAVEGPSGSVATQAHLLEQSALQLRNGSRTGGGAREASARKESTYLTHGLHRYKGKFYPQLCRSLLNIAGLDAGDLVLDPFMGSGTTLVECAISGIDSVGCDLHPLAHLIASTKLRLLQSSPRTLQGGLSHFHRDLVAACRDLGLRWGGPGAAEPDGDRTFPAARLAVACGLPEAADEIRRWFPPAVCHKLVAVLRTLGAVSEPALRGLVQVCLSDQIRSVSQQDPRDLRIRRRARAIDDAPLLTLISGKLAKEVEKLRAGLSVLDGPARAGVATAELADARTLERRQHPVLARRRVDAIVTSPPYANALPYIDTDRLSLLVLGLVSTRARPHAEKHLIGNREIHDSERRALEAEMDSPVGLPTFPEAVAAQLRLIRRENQQHAVGFRRRNVPALLYKYFRDMRTVMGRLHEAARAGARAFIVLGDSTTRLGGGEALVIRTTEHVASLAEQVGWRPIDAWPITVTVEDLAHLRNAITENRILVLRRGR